jgi:hypothetical protein
MHYLLFFGLDLGLLEARFQNIAMSINEAINPVLARTFLANSMAKLRTIAFVGGSPDL